MIGIDWSPNAALLSDDTTEITLESELFITSPSVLWQPQLALRGNDTYCISCTESGKQTAILKTSLENINFSLEKEFLNCCQACVWSRKENIVF
jgi:hypothetical protein